MDEFILDHKAYSDARRSVGNVDLFYKKFGYYCVTPRNFITFVAETSPGVITMFGEENKVLAVFKTHRNNVIRENVNLILKEIL